MTSSRVENSSGRAARKMRLALMGPAFIAAIGYIMGSGLGEPDGDADSGVIGQAWYRHR